jgi:hypothetical protein
MRSMRIGRFSGIKNTDTALFLSLTKRPKKRYYLIGSNPSPYVLSG